MASSLWWLRVLSLLLAGLAAGDDPLIDHEFLRSFADGRWDQHVQQIRDVFLQRVRCGSQREISMCQECLPTRKIIDITKISDEPEDESRRIRELSRASVVFLHFFLSFQKSCTPENIREGLAGGCRSHDQCWSQVGGRLASLTKSSSPAEELESLENVLREVKAIYEPKPSRQCFSAELVLSELNTKSSLQKILSRDAAAVLLLASHLYAGECIDVGESVADFLDDIFLHYGDGCERVMTQSGFTKLWNDLQMQRRGKHIDHGMQENSCTLKPTEKRIKMSTPTPSTDSLSSQRTPENKTEVVVLVPDPSSSNTNHKNGSMNPSESDVYVVGEKVPESKTAEMATPVRRIVRHTPSSSDHEHKSLANECLPSDDLLQRFLTHGNQVITSSEFLQLCPALVQQAVSGVCSARLKAAVIDRPITNETIDVLQQEATQSASPWLAVAAVALITAASLLGLFLLPVLKKSFFVHINAFFTGLAFGTMSGDVVLHLMPQYLGLHQHDEQGHDHDEESTIDRLFPSHLQRQLVFLFTMYLLFLVECIFTVCTGEKKEHSGHSHGPVEISMRDLSKPGDAENAELKPKLSRCTRISDFLKPSNLFSGISSKAAVIVLADTVHNFADGMAIAVGFSTSYKDGLSTSIAVFFHELPHEIGDFAVLMNCGLSYWKAFVFNILSGLTAFIGLGVGVFTASLFREWLLCITAGLFFFVVMGEMLPDMRLESKEKWREFAVKIIGTVMGIITMICIAMYELSKS